MAASLLLLPTQSSQTRSAPQTAILESENRESAAATRETEKGGHGAEVRDSLVVVMAKEQRGKMAGREKELKHGDHSFTRRPSPRSCPQRGYERRGRRALLPSLRD